MYVCTVDHCTEWPKCMSAQWITVRGGLNVCLHSGAPCGPSNTYKWYCTVRVLEFESGTLRKVLLTTYEVKQLTRRVGLSIFCWFLVGRDINVV